MTCKYCGKKVPELFTYAIAENVCEECTTVYVNLKDMSIRVLAAILFDLREELLK